MAFDENCEVLVANEGNYTVYINDPAAPATTRAISPKGKLVIPFKALRDALYGEGGNREIYTQYLTIVDPDVRRALDIDDVPVIDNATIKKHLHYISDADIETKLVRFLKEAGPGIKERIAELAVEEGITDIRILTQLERYTPYKSIIDRMREQVQDKFMESEEADED